MYSRRHTAARVPQYLDTFPPMLPAMVSCLRHSLREYWRHAPTAAVQSPVRHSSMPSEAEFRQTHPGSLCQHHNRVTAVQLLSDRVSKRDETVFHSTAAHWDLHRSQVRLVLPPDCLL